MKLNDLKSLRNSKVVELKALATKDADSEEGLAEDEATKFDALKSEIDSLDTRIGRIESAMKVDAEEAEPTDSSDDDEKDYAPVKKAFKPVASYGGGEKPAVDKPGFKMARYVIGMFHAREKGIEGAANFIERRFGDSQVAKSLNATVTSTQGMETIPTAFSTDFIELLRPRVAVRDLGPRSLDLTYGNLTVPRMTGGSTANYIGELAPIPTSQPSFDQIHLTAKKLAAMVPVSNDLLRRSPLNVEEIVRDDMLQQVARKEDIVFIRNTTSGTGIPLGLLGLINNSNKLTATAVSGSFTKLDQARSLFSAMLLQMENNYAPMIRPGFIFSPSVRYYLANLRDGVGGFPFGQMLDAGNIDGIPFRTVQTLPTNLTAAGGTHGSEIFLVDFSEFIVADSLNIQVKVSDVASYTDGSSNQVNAFQTDETVFRLITEHDTALRHPGSIVMANVDSWFPGA